MIDLKSTFKSFDDKKIMVIGDIMIDAYIFGDVDRVSPEAPVPVLDLKSRDYRLGGAGNVARNIMSLGAKPIMCTVVGNDEDANIIRNLLTDKHGISDEYVMTSNRITTCKTRMISQSQQLLRLDSEDISPLSNELSLEFIALIKKAIDKESPEAIILEDYDKGVITPLLITEIGAYAKSKGIITTADPKHRNFDDYKGVTLFKPNFKEFMVGTKTVIAKNDFDALLALAKEYRQEKNIDNLLITLSEYGVLIIDKDSHFHIPAEKRDISDVSGAGDTVISVITLCMTTKMPINKATQIANIAGGLVCEKIGVVPIDKSELLNETLRIVSNK